MTLDTMISELEAAFRFHPPMNCVPLEVDPEVAREILEQLYRLQDLEK